MRSHGSLFSRLCDEEHLENAARFTLRGKRRRADAAWFRFVFEDALADLRDELRSRRYRSAGFDCLVVRDPKRRVIARASFRDRVIHAAVGLLLEPIVVRASGDDAWASRAGRGTHRARLRLLEFMRRYRFCLHLDVRSYFPSIDIEIVRRLLARRIRDDDFLAVMDRILASGRGFYDVPWVRRVAGISADWPPSDRGLPIGAFTSQLLAAHLYLAETDHFVKRSLRVPGYVRYVDDFFLFETSRERLRRARRELRDHLSVERNLRLKHPHAPIISTREELHGLGARIRRDGICPMNRILKTMARRVRSDLEQTRRGRRARVDVERTLASAAGCWMAGAFGDRPPKAK